tara:strand:- start:268 stop:585 length:318 start_codon:yes stop_codon:yes gene_type:complete
MLVSPVYNAYELQKLFAGMGRGEQFSFEAFETLFDLLTWMSKDSGNDFVIDVIGLCCDFAEYESIEDYNEQNGTEFVDWESVQDDGNVENWTFVKDGKVGGIVHG